MAKYNCKTCGYSTGNRSKLNKHLWEHRDGWKTKKKPKKKGKEGPTELGSGETILVGPVMLRIKVDMNVVSLENVK